MKVLCIGESLLETTCPVESPLVEGEKRDIVEKYENGGGHAGNVAYILGKWGVDTYIASMLGSDDAANKIKKEFETIGVKTDLLETSYDKGTSSSLVLVNKNNKVSTIIKLNNGTTLKKYAFSIEPDIIISDGSDFNASVAAFDKFPNASSYLFATKYDNQIIELCRYAKNIIFTQKVAEGISNIKVDVNDGNTVANLYNALKQKHSKTEIIITLGNIGSAYSINGQIKIMPPIKVDEVDSNGAADAYLGAYIYAMGRNFGIEKSVAYATICASLSVTKLTSRGSFPTITEVSSYYDTKFGAANNPNNNVQSGQQSQNPQSQTAAQQAPVQNEQVAKVVPPTEQAAQAPAPAQSQAPAAQTNQNGN